MENTIDHLKPHKTGHIVVERGFIAGFNEICTESLWENLIMIRKAQFFPMAFNVEVTETSRITHVSTTYKWRLPKLYVKKDLSIFHLLENGCVVGLFNEKGCFGFPTDVYGIMPVEKATYSTSEQQKIIFQYPTPMDTSSYVVTYPDFNPDYLDRKWCICMFETSASGRESLVL